MNRVRATVFDEVSLSRGARNHQRVWMPCEHPGERELRARTARRSGNFIERPEQTAIFLKIWALEARHAAPQVTLEEVGRAAQVAGEHGAAQRAEGDERRADATALFQHRDFRITRPQ